MSSAATQQLTSQLVTLLERFLTSADYVLQVIECFQDLLYLASYLALNSLVVIMGYLTS